MANVTGELGGQPIILENAATEATLNALLQATLANSSNRSQAAKIQQAYEEAVKRTTKQQKENAETIAEEEKRRSDLNKQIEEEKERRKKMMQGMSEAATALKNVGQTMGNLLGGAMSAAFNSATPKVSDFTDALSGIPIIGPVIGAVGKAMQDQIDKFRQLSTVGADFGGSIDHVRKVAAEAGLSLETYTKTITENGKSLAMLGGSTAEGAKIFNRVSASLQGPFQQSLARLGFTMEETAEYTAGYLAQQTRLGRAQRMTQEELNQGTQQYLLELDMLARVHGMSRKEAQAALDAQTQDKRFKLFYAQMGSMGEQTKSFMAGLSSTNKEFSDGLADLIMNNGVPSANNEMAKSIALQSPRLKELAMQLKQGTISQEEANRVVREEAARMEELAESQGGMQAQFLNLNNSSFLANSSLVGMSKYGLKAAEAAGAQATSGQNAARNAANLDKALLDLRNNVMDKLMPVFVVFQNAILTAIPAITNFIAKLAGIVENEGVRAAIVYVVKQIGEIMVSALGEMLTSPTVIGAMLAGIGLLWGATAIKMAIVKGIKDAFDGAKKDTGPRPGQYGDWQKGQTPQGPTSDLPDKKGGGWKKWGGRLLRGGGLLGLGGMAVDYAGEKAAEAGHVKTGAALDIVGTTGKYAGLGAMIGSVVPGLGTAVGGGIGGLFGLGAGLFASGGKLFGGSSKPADAAAKTNAEVPKDVAVAAEVARTTTAKEVKELAAALKELDYAKLIVPDEAHKSMETGALKMRQLRGEVIAMSAAFKELNNTGLDKITQGLGRLDESFKSFNKSFVEQFMVKFKELDKKSQEQLLTDLNTKMDLLNTTMTSILEIEEENNKHVKNTARNTKSSSGRVN